MVEDAASSNAPERLRSRMPLKPVVWAPIWNAWLETLQARAQVEEGERDPRTPAAPARIVDAPAGEG